MEDAEKTIETLRARLLAERSLTKAARQRADQLAKKVDELQARLEVEIIQKKRAEKATAKVLMILQSCGVDEYSEGYDTDSLQEDGASQSNSQEFVAADSESLMQKETLPCSGNKNYQGVNAGQLDDVDVDVQVEDSLKSGRTSACNNCDIHFHCSHGNTMRKSRELGLRQKQWCTTSVSTDSSQIRRSGKSCHQVRREELENVDEHEDACVCSVDSQMNGHQHTLEVGEGKSSSPPLYETTSEQTSSEENAGVFPEGPVTNPPLEGRKRGSGSEPELETERTLVQQAGFMYQFPLDGHGSQNIRDNNNNTTQGTPCSCFEQSGEATEEHDFKNATEARHVMEREYANNSPHTNQLNPSAYVDATHNIGRNQGIERRSPLSVEPIFARRENHLQLKTGYGQRTGKGPIVESPGSNVSGQRPPSGNVYVETSSSPGTPRSVDSQTFSTPAKHHLMTHTFASQDNHDRNSVESALNSLRLARFSIQSKLGSLSSNGGIVASSGDQFAKEDPGMAFHIINCAGLFRLPSGLSDPRFRTSSSLNYANMDTGITNGSPQALDYTDHSNLMSVPASSRYEYPYVRTPGLSANQRVPDVYSGPGVSMYGQVNIDQGTRSSLR